MQTTAYPDQTADLAVVTGEASGDWIAALAIESLLAEHTTPGESIRIEGIAGPKLREMGVSALHQSEELSVRGYVEVIRHLPRLFKLRKRLVERWTSSQAPKVLLGVDAPDFNLTLEKACRDAGIPTIHLVCPSIWAWRYKRIHTLKAACDHILCLFPFEPEILAKEKIQATYIGHPMAQLIPKSIDINTYRQQLGLPVSSSDELLAVLPGSRRAEIDHIGPIFVQAVQLLLKAKPHLKLITPLPNPSLIERFKRFVPDKLSDQWLIVEDQSHQAMGASNAILLASGTATLEAMMFKKPMVIAYKMPWLSYQLMKGKGHMPYVGLPNILLGEFAVPELIQDQAKPESLCKSVLTQLDNDQNRDRLTRLFEEQHERLLLPSGALCAQVIQGYLQ